MRKRDLGQLGEKLACSKLKKNGYHIVEKNYRCRYGEIDIIAKHKNSIVFIEVRSKSGTAYGTPEESVTEDKKRKIISTAMNYLGDHPEIDGDWRIDMVAVEFDSNLQTATRINIIQNAVN
jgi:putative endonuclease